MFNPLLKAGTGEVNLSANLLHHILLQNNANDIVGDFLPTTTDGTPEGDKRYFDGVDDYIADTAFNTSTIKTISFWAFRWSDITSSTANECMLDFVETSEEFSIRLGSSTTYLTNETLTIHTGITSPYGRTCITDTIPGGMHHYLFTWDGSNWKIYIDKVQKTTTHGTDGAATSMQTTGCNGIWVGASSTLGTPFEGDMNNIRLYSTEDISQGFINALYDESYYHEPLTPTTTGLLAHYPLCGTGQDITGNYDPGAVLLTYQDNWQFGTIADFDGTDDRINVGTIPIDDDMQLTSSWTMSFFIKADSFTTSPYIVNKSTGATSADGYGIRFNTSGVLRLESDGVDRGAISTALTIGNWYYFYIWSTGGQCRSYYKDTSIGLFFNDYELLTQGLTIPNVSANLRIGAAAYTPANFFDGKLRELKIYSNASGGGNRYTTFGYELNTRFQKVSGNIEAYLLLDSNSLDYTSNGYDGTDTGMVYSGTYGTFGTGKYVDINAHSAGTVLSTQNYTICFWMRATTISGSSSNAAVSFGGGTTGVGFGILKTTGKIGVGGSLTGSNDIVASSITAQTNTWYHVAVRRWTSSGNLQIFINGVEDNNDTLTHGDGTGSDAIGGSNTGNPMDSIAASCAFFGDIANVRIYHEGLVEQEVKTIYNIEKDTFI